ncbi:MULTISPECIES: hypothetical protein [Pontibacillus]|uniref:Uncharacterized protein n=1 Tax=Pontibacillus chungwhensis TaxID=265426 RepID=A0ABY8UZ28_9BACI|nr:MULTISPECIES: hypothetical protein [Pontibacillus]WIF98752.1 hypothetical protein QNI29_03615 [Pontibacillus chungwhensis]
MQDQLDQAVAGGDQLAETQQARVGEDGTTYDTLKARLDAEHSTLESSQNVLSGKLQNVAAEFSQQARKKSVLTHGTNVIKSDQPSSLKVEFYGNTLVNNVVNFNHSDWSLHSNVTISNDKKIIHENTSGSKEINSIFINVKENQNYLLRLVHNGKLSIIFRDSGGAEVGTRPESYSTAEQSKFTTPSGAVSMQILLSCTTTGTHTFEELRAYTITQEVSDKIGVSLSDADVERMFPDVDGMQSVENPYVRVSGSQLIPTNVSEWEQGHLNAVGAKGSDPSRILTTDYHSIAPNQTYTVSVNSGYRVYLIYYYNENKSFISSDLYRSGGATFTTPTNAVFYKISIEDSNDNAITPEDLEEIKPMLTLGTEPKPFVPKNDSYLYAQCTLAGLPLSDKRDNLFRNEAKNRWEIRKWVERVTLDGSFSWSFQSEYSGFKRVKINMIGYSRQSQKLEKYDGEILNQFTSSLDKGDLFDLHSTDNYLWITVSDNDSGWTEAMTPTSDMIKGYFNGWKYTGDGTTHSWVSIVDGTTIPATQTAAFVANPANMASGYTPYKLSYELAEPETLVEGIDFPYVEGDLSIQDSAQVEIGEGLIVREEANPIQYSDGRWFINRNFSNLAPSKLERKANRIIAIYKNVDGDTKWKAYTNDGVSNSYGAYAEIPASDYDPNATYTVTYEVLDKHDFTANVLEVPVWYNQSLKSSIQSAYSKLSDHGTEISILKPQVYKLLLAAKVNGWEV